ncbi:hypothetical protein [Okeania sp.]|nr:hypothetical protein [Okeania sp.]MEB3342626.1 hypothetical protein [Okeania sp.]
MHNFQNYPHKNTVNIDIDKAGDRSFYEESDRHHNQTKNTCYFYTKECT